MLKSTLVLASRSARARRLIESFPPTRRVVDRFVPGESVESALEAAGRIVADGLLVTLDVLGEDVTSADQASRNTETYLGLLDQLGARAWTSQVEVSLKLSALGQALTGVGEDVALANGRLICAKAAELGNTVTLDMEDHSTVDSSLRIGAALRADYPGTGTVLQSNLRRTEGDIEALAGQRVRVRLVKGAYAEPPDVAYQSKDEVNAAYLRGIGALMRSQAYPMIGSHDAAMVRAAVELAKAVGRADDAWEVQMLYGIRTDYQRQLAADGLRMRVYVPFGVDWYGYFMRRLAERPANLAFFLRALFSR